MIAPLHIEPMGHRPRSAALRLLMAYGGLLAAAALFDRWFPSQAAALVEGVFRDGPGAMANGHARYRMVLFIAGSAICLALSLVGLFRGIEGQNTRGIRALHFGVYLFSLAVMFLGWAAYPALALCRQCWTNNDVFYFLLTVFFFLAMQLLVHATFTKITSYFKGS